MEINKTMFLISEKRYIGKIEVFFKKLNQQVFCLFVLTISLKLLRFEFEKLKNFWKSYKNRIPL